jgi:hypothetical protein
MVGGCMPNTIGWALMSREGLRVVTYLSELILISCDEVEVLGHRGGGRHLEVDGL